MTSDLCPPAPRAVVPWSVVRSSGWLGSLLLAFSLDLPSSISDFLTDMSVAELEKVTKAWPPISHGVRVPHTAADCRDLVELLDRVTDKVGRTKVIRLLRSWTSLEC